MNEFKLKMKNKIKDYSNDNYMDDYIKKEFDIKNGTANIYIFLNNNDELIDSRTRGVQTELVNSIYEYFESKSSMLENDVKITFHINGLDINEEDKLLVKNLFREHYSIELYKAQKEYKSTRNKIIKLICLGFSCFLLYVIFFFNSNFDFFLEVFGFIFSFALWEGFDAMIYSLSEAEDNREAVTQNLLTDIVFE
ncbi:MAG: hypothetical protein Q4E69_05610 [Bacilli bacterium]|nr:hypothetical protein [Bacilli bacterium]